ncbi:MAG: RNA polymerase sigma-70 factor [Chitinophagaceae bacterium]|nr:RNA polymerase sigma-70 factor [Chitinophagaceae bacterium]
MPADPIYNELRLLQQLSAGSEEALKYLFNRYYDKLFRYVAVFIKSDQVAEELVMDVFMKIWLGRDMVIHIENMDAFLFRVAKNKAIDFLRSAARNDGLKQLLYDRIDMIASERSDTALLVQEYEEKIREAINLLSPQRKKVYLVSREEELTHDEIAERFGISRHTVNNHIVMARQFIRHYLARNMDIAFLVLLGTNYF